MRGLLELCLGMNGGLLYPHTGKRLLPRSERVYEHWDTDLRFWEGGFSTFGVSSSAGLGTQGLCGNGSLIIGSNVNGYNK